ncbi:hypothetical protein JAAARDRAFT_40058 [Jaapia argillacea MUCL 33604]|uniref:NADAR domain-containing protein n=1 Tax=Jaapia argillacea MUCL 33604 TaxID=933084 RepID=A0A067PNA1_9AGAM|nr:hypothetical protein JAAARDRAFT_40058 [Jaapia argillacea MUCL 33604]
MRSPLPSTPMSMSSTIVPEVTFTGPPPTPGAPLRYVVEERRRTFYVTSAGPPTRESIDRICQLADISESDSTPVTPAMSRSRPKSYVEREVFFSDTEATGRTRSPGAKGPVNLRVSNSLPNSPAPGTPRSPLSVRPRIYFYHSHDPYYGFTNFSPHAIIYKGKRYPTSEHLFQSFKFQQHRPLLAEHIRTCSERPSMALSEARRFQPEVRSDWMQKNIEAMDETLWHKFNQHEDLKQELLSTGDAELIEDSDKDSFWGVGADRKGRNELGKALERLREKLQATS